MSSLTAPTLSTDRLRLRAFEPQDVDDVFAICQDDAIQRFTSVPSPYTREDADHFVNEFAPRGWIESTTATFAFLSGGALQGLVSVTFRQRRDRGVAAVGYWCRAEARGQGMVPEALRAASQWAFADLRVRRLEWIAEVGNHSSRRVADKLGFRHEGTLRDYLVHRGQPVDAWIASLLPGELA